MLYNLYISYRDSCYHETFKIEVSNATHALKELKHLAMFEQHWITNHPEEGPFPFGTFPIHSDINHPCPYFPSLDEVHQKMEALAVDEMKYVMRANLGVCSYFVSIRRV